MIRREEKIRSKTALTVYDDDGSITGFDGYTDAGESLRVWYEPFGGLFAGSNMIQRPSDGYDGPAITPEHLQLMEKTFDEVENFLASGTDQSRACWNAIRGPADVGAPYTFLKLLRKDLRWELGTLKSGGAAGTYDTGSKAKIVFGRAVFIGRGYTVSAQIGDRKVPLTASQWRKMVVFHEISHGTGKYVHDLTGIISGKYQFIISNDDLNEVVFKNCMGSQTGFEQPVQPRRRRRR
jgi:hypothetical protein